jgi:hypothetical protein
MGAGDTPHDSRLAATVTDGDGPAALLVPDDGGGPWLVDPGPPGSDEARDLLRDLGPSARAAGVFLTRTDEAHAGVLPELGDRLHDDARFVAAPGGTEAGEAAVHDAATDEEHVVHPGAGESVAIATDVAVVPLTNPALRAHPDTMALDVRVRDEFAPAAQPESLLFPGDVDAEDEGAVRRAAAGIYSHSTKLHRLEQPENRQRPWVSRLYLNREWREENDHPTRAQFAAVDHRHRPEGGQLVSEATESVLAAEGADVDADAARPAPDGNGWVTVHVTDRGTALEPTRGSVRSLVDGFDPDPGPSSDEAGERRR